MPFEPGGHRLRNLPVRLLIGGRPHRAGLEAGGQSFDKLIETKSEGAHFLTQSAARWCSVRTVFIPASADMF